MNKIKILFYVVIFLYNLFVVNSWKFSGKTEYTSYKMNVLNDKLYLYAFGRVGNANIFEYDNGNWRKAYEMKSPRKWHQIVQHNNRLIYLGGCSSVNCDNMYKMYVCIKYVCKTCM